MKQKLTLLLLALFVGIVGVLAQTPVTSITSGKAYYFFNSRFDQFINSSWKTDASISNAIKFTLTGSDGNYNIYSADRSGYLTWGTLNNGAVPTVSAETSENTLWTIDVQDGLIMNIYPKGQTDKELISQSATAGKDIALWDFNNQGGQWYIYDAEDLEEIIAAKASIIPGMTYRIFTYNNGTEEGSTKYYLSETGYLTDSKVSAGLFTFTATTTKGVVPTGHAWFVKNSSGTAFSNPEGSTRDNHIHQSSWNSRQDWDTQVFYLNNGKYAIRATNAAPDNTWYSHAFWTVDADDDASGLPDADYTIGATVNTKHYVWQIEDAAITITYNVKMGGVTVATKDVLQIPGTASSLPTSLQNNWVDMGDPDVATVSEVNNVVNYTATLKSNFPATYSTDYENATWYYWKLNGNYVSYTGTAPYDANGTKPTTDAGLWAFIGTPYGTKIINKEAGEGKYLQANSNPEMTTTPTEWVLARNTNYSIQDNFTTHAGANNYLNYSGGKLKYWNNSAGATDNGSTFTVEEYSPEYAGDVATYITPYFDNHGSYFALTDAAYSANEATWSAATTTCDKTTYDALYAVVTDEDNIVWPATGYYLLKNNNSATYFNTTGASSVVNATNNAASSIIKLINNGDGTYSIMSQGQYLNAPAGAGSAFRRSDTPLNFTPTIGSATKVCFTVEGGSMSSYDNLSVSGSSVVGFPARGISTDPQSYWIVEDAPASISVPLNAANDNTSAAHTYATLCVPFNITGLTGYDSKEVQAYKPTIDGSYILPGSGATTIDAGTPVLLIGAEGASSVTATIGSTYVTSPVAPSASDALTGVFTGTTIDCTAATGTTFVLGKDATNGDRVGFYHVNNGEFALGANRAYLVVGGGAVKGYVLNFDDAATGLEGVQDVQEVQGAIYNLAGQRLNKIQKGINIVNGKKILK